MSESHLLARYVVTKEKDELLFCESEPGETLFFLQKGNVRLMKIINNQEKNLAIIRPGDIFGEMAILEKQPRSATAITETRVQLLELNKSSFLTLVKTQPAIGIKLLQNLSSRIIDQKRKLTIINHSDNKTKVLDTLMLFYEKDLSRKGGANNDILLKVDAREVSNWAAISENESRITLENLQSNNYIDYDEKKGTIFLKDIELVRSLIERKKINS